MIKTLFLGNLLKPCVTSVSNIPSVEILSYEELQLINGGGIIREFGRMLGVFVGEIVNAATYPNYKQSSGSSAMHSALH